MQFSQGPGIGYKLRLVSLALLGDEALDIGTGIGCGLVVDYPEIRGTFLQRLSSGAKDAVGAEGLQSAFDPACP